MALCLFMIACAESNYDMLILDFAVVRDDEVYNIASEKIAGVLFLLPFLCVGPI